MENDSTSTVTRYKKTNGYLCWPFTSKGHFHLPSGIAPVLMDIQCRYNLAENPNQPFLYLPYSWNMCGKPITDQVLSNLLGINRAELTQNEVAYINLIHDNLETILSIAPNLVELNIRRSTELMSPLNLMKSGYYEGDDIQPYEFRDDHDEYAAFVQARFVEWYTEKLSYLKIENGRPCFYLDIQALYKRKPLTQLLTGISVDRSIQQIFSNNYRKYNRDLPISTIGGYATPVPIYVDDNGRPFIQKLGEKPIDPRLNSQNKNHLLVIKPLINCYLFAEYLAQKFGGFDRLLLSNDYHMATRLNFVSLLLSKRHYEIMNLYIFKLLQDPQGNTYSQKGNIIQNIADLELELKGASRFIIIKNTRIGSGSIRVDIDSKTLSKVQAILKFEQAQFEQDEIFSPFYRRNVSIRETLSYGLERGNISQMLNFLINSLYAYPGNQLIQYYLKLLLVI